jgi:dipeptidyl aminopeptidase/acylaminoacyl peptidase
MRATPALLLCAVSALSLFAQNQPFTVDAMLAIQRISDPQLSPDGSTVAFTVQTTNIAENTRPQQIWTVPAAGGTPVQITHEGALNNRARWMPDGKRLLFISNRGGSPQVWSMDPAGGDAKAVTRLSTTVGDLSIAPDGKTVVFTSEVYPECGDDDACNKKKLEAEKESKVKARIYTTLLYRHWNEWQGATRRHLMAMPLDSGKVRDLTPGKLDVPSFSLGGQDDFSISPDSKEVAYVSSPDTDLALSTNDEVFIIPINGGEAKKVSTSPGADRSPAYSPDGKYLAFRSQVRAGYEADRWRLMVLDRATGTANSLTEAIDQPVEGFTWAPGSSHIFFVVEDRGRGVLQMVPVGGGGVRSVITGHSHVDDIQFAADGKTMIYTEQTEARPTEIYRVSSTGGAAVPLTKLNDALLSRYSLLPAEDFWVEVSDGVKVQSFLFKPPNFDPTKKYPALMLIHGGPQGAWGRLWQYRWNAQIFAAAGYIVFEPNPRGSTGYGQKFTDDINQDWGGKPFEDLMDAADYVAKLPYVDPERMAAGGGSYGGYMANWILGHTNRFKALVSHSGPFDLASSNLETEELWFPKWEFGGLAWENPDLYRKLSPATYITDFKTPTLVMHGELDYRVPVGQSMQLFTALQVQKIPSKLVLFPDEGHWILKPQNTQLWYRSFLDWIGEWTRKAGSQ